MKTLIKFVTASMGALLLLPMVAMAQTVPSVPTQQEIHTCNAECVSILEQLIPLLEEELSMILQLQAQEASTTQAVHTLQSGGGGSGGGASAPVITQPAPADNSTTTMPTVPAITVTPGNTSAQPNVQPDQSATGTYTLAFEVSAGAADLYVPATGGVTYVAVSPADPFGGTATDSLASDAEEDSGYFKVPANGTQTFTLTVILTNAPATSGFYAIQASAVSYSPQASPAGAQAQGFNEMTTPIRVVAN